VRYEEMYREAVKAKALKNLTPDFHAWQKEGEALVGKLISRAPVDSSLGQGSYMQYLMETDQGLVKFALGAATDKELAGILKDGGVYRVEYLGQVPIKGGRRVNRFRVYEISTPEPEEITDADVPF